MGPIEVARLRAELETAHEFLVLGARAAVERLRGADTATWGADAKRVSVVFEGTAPARVSRHPKHNFIEVVNQCATLERLIDALAWSEERLHGYLVQTCHPTTSSAGTDHDHDLVLHSTAGALPAYFEVSDILSGAAKELRDLQTLRVPTDGAAWPAARLFMIVSGEMAKRVTSPSRALFRRRAFRYEAHPHARSARTGILEVIPNAGSDAGDCQNHARTAGRDGLHSGGED